MQFRQLGRQLLEESPTVLTQLSGKFFILVKIELFGTGTGSEMRFSDWFCKLLGLKLSLRTVDKTEGKY